MIMSYCSPICSEIGKPSALRGVGMGGAMSRKVNWILSSTSTERDSPTTGVFHPGFEGVMVTISSLLKPYESVTSTATVNEVNELISKSRSQSVSPSPFSSFTINWSSMYQS